MDIPGLPKSRDPYEPANRDFEKPLLGPKADTPEDEELDLGGLEEEDEPIPNQGEIAGLEDESGTEIDSAELNPDDIGDLGPEVSEEPAKPHWGPISLPNKKDIGFQRSDGFILRMRKLESVPGRWLAQLYRDEDIISGPGPKFLDVPAGEDPYKYAQKTADLSLDAFSKRYDQQMSSTSADRGLYAGMPGSPPPPPTMSPKPSDLTKEVSPPTFTEPSAPARGGGSKGLELGGPGGAGVGGGGATTEPGKEQKKSTEVKPGEPGKKEEELDIGDLELEP